MAILFHNRIEHIINPNKQDTIVYAHKIINSKLYHVLLPEKHYSESKLETQIITCLTELYGNSCFVIPYKKNIIHKNKVLKSKPDILIISKAFNSWYIIEVELYTHRFGHMAKQMDVFYNHDRKSIVDENKYICDKIRSDIDINFNQDKKVCELISNENPSIVLMADHIRSDFRSEFESKGLKLKYVTFQHYIDSNKTEFFRINDNLLFKIHSDERQTKSI